MEPEFYFESPNAESNRDRRITKAMLYLRATGATVAVGAGLEPAAAFRRYGNSVLASPFTHPTIARALQGFRASFLGNTEGLPRLFRVAAEVRSSFQ